MKPAVLLLLTMTLLLSGCSLLFVQPPRPSGSGASGHGCTTSKVAPVLDTMFASWQVMRIGIAATASEDAYRGAALSRGADMMLGVLFGVIGASSAVYGFRATDECRDRPSNPYAPARRPELTRQQRAAEEAAEEAAVRARLKARAANAADGGAASDSDADEEPDAGTGSPAPAPNAPVRQRVDPE